MSTWYKAAWIPPLFAAVDAIAPNRTHDQDGTIGDLAHASGVSGHNPDDTPGVTAERQDADSKPEVRAADVDARLNQPGLSMEMIVREVVTARDPRLIYVIFNRRIWRAANGWRQESYTGTDPHDLHAHFSGHPDADENGSPWPVISNLGADMDQSEKLSPPYTDNPDLRVGNALNIGVQGRDILVVDVAKSGYGAPKPASLAGRVMDIQAAVKALAVQPLSQEAVNVAVAGALSDPAIVAGLAKAINDDAARRLAS